MISDIKRTSHHAVIITNYAIWHQSLKIIHYRMLLIFQIKKNNRFEGQNMGGIKDMLSPMSKHGGDTYPPPPSPPGFTPLYATCSLLDICIFCGCFFLIVNLNVLCSITTSITSSITTSITRDVFVSTVFRQISRQKVEHL